MQDGDHANKKDNISYFIPVLIQFSSTPPLDSTQGP